MTYLHTLKLVKCSPAIPPAIPLLCRWNGPNFHFFAGWAYFYRVWSACTVGTIPLLSPCYPPALPCVRTPPHTPLCQQGGSARPEGRSPLLANTEPCRRAQPTNQWCNLNDGDDRC